MYACALNLVAITHLVTRLDLGELWVMDDISLYLPCPEKTMRGKAIRVFRRLTFDMWRRKLNKFKREQHSEQLRIVDVGCGHGFLMSCFERWFPGAELTGVDRSQELLDLAKLYCKTGKFVKGDASSLDLPDGSADVIFAWHVVEHLAQPSDFFTAASRILRPGGILVFATPNHDGLAAKLFKEKWGAYSDHTHISLHGPSYWRDVVKSAGLKVVSDGTTGLAGIPILNRFPFGLIYWIPGFIFGYYPWHLGEAYVCMSLRPAS